MAGANPRVDIAAGLDNFPAFENKLQDSSQDLSNSDVLSGVQRMLQNMGLHSVHQDINELRIVVDQFNFKHTELQQSLAQQDIARNNARTQCLEAENKILRARMHMSENRIMHLETEVSDIKSKVLDIQSRRMKDNIVFQGLSELRGENTRSVLSKFMTTSNSCQTDHRQELYLEAHKEFSRYEILCFCPVTPRDSGKQEKTIPSL